MEPPWGPIGPLGASTKPRFSGEAFRKTSFGLTKKKLASGRLSEVEVKGVELPWRAPQRTSAQNPNMDAHRQSRDGFPCAPDANPMDVMSPPPEALRAEWGSPQWNRKAAPLVTPSSLGRISHLFLKAHCRRMARRWPVLHAMKTKSKPHASLHQPIQGSPSIAAHCTNQAKPMTIATHRACLLPHRGLSALSAILSASKPPLPSLLAIRSCTKGNAHTQQIQSFFKACLFDGSGH